MTVKVCSLGSTRCSEQLSQAELQPIIAETYTHKLQRSRYGEPPPFSEGRFCTVF